MRDVSIVFLNVLEKQNKDIGQICRKPSHKSYDIFLTLGGGPKQESAAASADVVNEREFHHRQEHEHGARPHPHVQSLHVRHCNVEKITCPSCSTLSLLFHEVKKPDRKDGRKCDPR